MTTIIACTDGSELAEQAIATGLALLTKPGDRVVLTTTVETLPTGLSAPVTQLGSQPGLPPPLPPEHEKAMAEVVLARGAELLTDTANRLGLPAAEHRVLDGKPGEAICELATELAADVIVIAQRGQGALRRAVMGSVSGYVIHHAASPVLVVPSKALSG